MKRILFIILLLTSLQGFAQPGFQGYLTNNSYRGINATQKAGLPADTFNVTGTLRNYKWIANKNNTLYLWNQSQLRWIAVGGGGGGTTYTFTLPLQSPATTVSIKGLSTVGSAGQSVMSNGTQWAYYYPFNSDSAAIRGLETKGRLHVLDGGANLDTLAIDATVITSYVQKTSSYTITLLDHTINCTSGTFTVMLPTAVGIAGQEFFIINTGSGTITVDGAGSETINGSTTYSLSASANKYVRVKSTGAAFIITGNN